MCRYPWISKVDEHLVVEQPETHSDLVHRGKETNIMRFLFSYFSLHYKSANSDLFILKYADYDLAHSNSRRDPYESLVCMVTQDKSTGLENQTT